MEWGAPQPVQAPVAPVSLDPQDPFDLAQLGVGVLQRHRPFDDQLDVDAVADCHLIDETAEIPLQLGHAGDELLAAALEVDDELLVPGRRYSFEERPFEFALAVAARDAGVAVAA